MYSYFRSFFFKLKKNSSYIGTDFLIFIPLLLVVFHMKHTLLTVNGGGIEFMQELFNANEFGEVNTLEIAYTYLPELLHWFVIFPIVLFILSSLFFSKMRLRYIFLSLASVIFSTILFIERKSFWEVGTFVSGEALTSGLIGVGFQYLTEYVHAESFVKLGLTWLMVAFFNFLAIKFRQKNRFSGISRCINRAYLITCFILITLSFVISREDNPYFVDFSLKALSNFYIEEVVAHQSIGILPLPNLQSSNHKEFNRIASSLVKKSKALRNVKSSESSKFFAKAEGYDLITIVLETGPAQVIDYANDPDFNTLRYLKNSGFTSDKHFTAHPYSTRAHFAIYSSMYPSNSRNDFLKMTLKEGHELKIPGLARSLLPLGYETAIFIPEDPYDWDKNGEMYDGMGFQKVQFCASPPSANDHLINLEKKQSIRKERDREVLEKLKSAVVKKALAGERYFYAFHPQYSHGPWSTKSADPENQFPGGRELFIEIDSWIGEIVDELKQVGRLDKTLILITGDHGIRTKTEHESFNGGTLSDITYRVPFLLYAPGIAKKEEKIAHVSNHVDIVPTLLDLLGANEYRTLEQGSSILSERNKDQIIFLFGKNYLGSDGSLNDSKSFMHKYMIEASYESDFNGRLTFPISTLEKKHGEVENSFWAQNLIDYIAVNDNLSKLINKEAFDTFFEVNAKN